MRPRPLHTPVTGVSTQPAFSALAGVDLPPVTGAPDDPLVAAQCYTAPQARQPSLGLGGGAPLLRLDGLPRLATACAGPRARRARPGLGGGGLALHGGPGGLRGSHPAARLVQHGAAAAQQAERVPLCESAPRAHCAGRPALAGGCPARRVRPGAARMSVGITVGSVGIIWVHAAELPIALHARPTRQVKLHALTCDFQSVTLSSQAVRE